jgi:uncharacterized protein
MTGFEWDKDKRLENIELRKVDFRVVVNIFDNPVIEAEDDREDYGEPRFRALGRFGQDYYFVAYTWRGTCRRIITAWKVGQDGKKRYEALLARRDRGDD